MASGCSTTQYRPLILFSSKGVRISNPHNAKMFLSEQKVKHIKSTACNQMENLNQRYNSKLPPCAAQ